jgi:hypothetical protein
MSMKLRQNVFKKDTDDQIAINEFAKKDKQFQRMVLPALDSNGKIPITKLKP